MASLQDKIQRIKKKTGVVSAQDLIAANYDERTTPPAGDDDAAEFEIFKDFLGGVQKLANLTHTHIFVMVDGKEGRAG